MLKTCTTLTVGIFEEICCIDEVFLMALTSTEQLFIQLYNYTERPLYKHFLHMIIYPISSNLCKKIYLQCYWLYNFPSFRSSHWRCIFKEGVLGNFAKFTGKQLQHSLFFNKVAGWGDCFWSLLCLPLKISCLFQFNRKMRWKKGNTMMEFKYLLFCLSINLFNIKDFKRNLTDGRSENVFKENWMLHFSWLEEFH